MRKTPKISEKSKMSEMGSDRLCDNCKKFIKSFKPWDESRVKYKMASILGEEMKLYKTGLAECKICNMSYRNIEIYINSSLR